MFCHVRENIHTQVRQQEGDSVASYTYLPTISLYIPIHQHTFFLSFLQYRYYFNFFFQNKNDLSQCTNVHSFSKNVRFHSLSLSLCSLLSFCVVCVCVFLSLFLSFFSLSLYSSSLLSLFSLSFSLLSLSLFAL